MENPAETVKKIQQPEPEAAEPDQPVPTAMEMAMRQAMERSKGDEEEQETPKVTERKQAQGNQEIENILSRTLEQKVNTGS
jgi:hypothetical protein